MQSAHRGVLEILKGAFADDDRVLCLWFKSRVVEEFANFLRLQNDEELR